MLISLAFLFCKEETPIEPNACSLGSNSSFIVEVYSMKDSVKKPIDRADVKLNGERADSTSQGKYYFGNLSCGSYELLINYRQFYPIIDTIKLVSNENKFSYEITNMIGEDMIYVINNNYYLRNKYGETTNITNTNESISSDIAFFSDKNKFLYVSYTGSSYKINEITLNPTQHRVIYESESAIRTVRISPNQEEIYFIKSLTDYWSGSINSLNLNTLQSSVVNAGPYYKAFLLNDCLRIAFEKRAGESEFRNYIINNYINADTTIIATIHLEKGGGIKAISPNDNYILLHFSYDGIPITRIYDITADEFVVNPGNDGHGMGKFTDDSQKYYGILSDYMDYDPPYPAVIIDIASGAKTVIDMTNSGDGFNALSYSEKSNKYLYSINGNIKIYEVSSGKSYDFIATDDEEHSARFIN